MTITLLLVDVQKDFHSGGSLAIPKADEDSNRVAQLIREQGSKIDRIVATLDTHQKLHIAHPSFWISGQEESVHPTPFTIISADDIRNGKWKPNPIVQVKSMVSNKALFDRSFFDDEKDEEFDLQWFCLEYATRLEARGRFQICIWPEHCLIGSAGHGVVDSVLDALNEWSAKTGGSVEWVWKGSNLLTEMYSALEADVPVSKCTTYNHELQNSLIESDLLLVCGQAMSHCVNYTLRDIVKHWTTPDDDSNKKSNDQIVLLTDCCSSVPGFESVGDTFQQEMKNAGVRLLTSVDVVSNNVLSN